MNKIQLLIEVDEKEYEDIKRGCITASTLRNAKQLPKGHGRLIDADKLNRKDVNCANVPMNFIDTAPTVIEAASEDKE